MSFKKVIYLNIILIIALWGRVGLSMDTSIYTYYKVNDEKINVGGTDSIWLKNELVISFTEKMKDIYVSFDSISLTYPQDDKGFIYVPAPVNFALPLNAFSEVSKWEFIGSNYDVIAKGKIEILGSNDEVYIIRQVTNDCVSSECDTRLFYYSLSKGLMAFSISYQDKSNEIWFAKQSRGIFHGFLSN